MPVIVRPILELDADDVRTATSLYKVNACSRNLHHEKKNTKQITIDGKPYFINIEKESSFTHKEERDIRNILHNASQYRWDVIYYVLNASSIDEAAQYIERYANKLGNHPDGRQKFCNEVDLYDVDKKWPRINRYCHCYPCTTAAHAADAADARSRSNSPSSPGRSQGGNSLKNRRHTYGSSEWRSTRRKDGGPLSPLYILKQRAKSNPTRTGGRKNRRKSGKRRTRRTALSNRRQKIIRRGGAIFWEIISDTNHPIIEAREAIEGIQKGVFVVDDMNNNNIQYHQDFREGVVYNNKTITNPELIGLLNAHRPTDQYERAVNTIPSIARVKILGPDTIKHIYIYNRLDALPEVPAEDDYDGYIIVRKREK